MGQIVVRNLSEDVVARLEAAAASEGSSLEDKVRAILEQAASALTVADLERQRAALDRAMQLGREAKAWREAHGVSEDFSSAEWIREDRDR
jgi:plasmid stability protein